MKYICIFTLFSGFLVHGQALTSRELSRFTDSAFSKGSRDHLVPGFVIAVVKSDSIIFSHGYGFANAEKGTPVTTETRFQLGSIGKVFTAIAVMQLVERGSLQLDKNVNEYLRDFKIVNPYKQPVTLFHLLTHTAGFNDRVIGYAARSNEEAQRLGDHLRSNLPPLMQEPGTEINYSNYGYALAGYLVEVASGLDFADYIRENILDKLQMNHTSYTLPANYENEPDYASGYAVRGERYVPVHAYPRHTLPSGSIISTAGDMAKLVRELLHPTQKLLGPDTFEKLVTTQFRSHPDVCGYTLGFEEQKVQGVAGFGKGGAIPGFLALMEIFPAQDMGLFVAINTQTDNFLEDFTRGFFKTFFSPDQRSFLPAVPADVDRLAGTYRSNRTNINTIEELGFLYQGKFSLWKAENNLLGCYHNGAFHEYRPVSEALFQDTADPSIFLFFRQDPNGTLHLYRSTNLGGILVPTSLQKVAWYNDPEFINEYYFIVLIWILTLIFIFPYRLWISRRRKKNPSKVYHLLPTGALVTAMIILTLYAAQMIFGFFFFFKNTQEFFFGIPDSFRWAQYSTFLLLPAIPLLIYSLVRMWTFKQSTLYRRIYFSTITLAIIIHFAFLYRWHFIGLQV